MVPKKMQPLPYLFDCLHMYALQSWQTWNLSPRKSVQKQQNCFSTVRKGSAMLLLNAHYLAVERSETSFLEEGGW